VLQASDAPPVADAPSLGRVLVGGTVSVVPKDEAAAAVLEYAETNADPDLFDVGRGVFLLQVEVAEIHLVRPGATPSSKAVDGWPGNANGAGWPGHGWNGHVRGGGWDSTDRNNGHADEAGMWRDGSGLGTAQACLPAQAASGSASAVDLDEYVAADPDPLYRDEPDLLADLNEHHGAQLQAYLAGRLAAAGLPDTTPRAVRLDRYGLRVRPYPDWRADPVRVSFARPVRDRSDLARLLHPVLFQP
jgi:hypothetical protein